MQSVFVWTNQTATIEIVRQRSGANHILLHKEDSKMGWERRGKRHYYYRARRDGNRVIKEYVGVEGSLKAENAAKEDTEMRAAKADLRGTEQKRRQAFEAVHAQVTALGRMASDTISSALLAAGYHQHCRGPWRKRRKR